MLLFTRIRNCFSIREINVTTRKYYQIAGLLAVSLLLHNCSRKPSLRELVETSPEQVIARQDSLLVVVRKNPEKLPLLMEAYLSVADQQLEAGQPTAAERTLEQGLALQPDNIDIKYALAMLRGKQLYKKGGSSELWDAIEQFNKASYYKPEDGIALYWIARGYEKNDEDDFENIIEYYVAALEKGLPEELQAAAQKALERAREDQELLKSFWQ